MAKRQKLCTLSTKGSNDAGTHANHAHAPVQRSRSTAVTQPQRGFGREIVVARGPLGQVEPVVVQRSGRTRSELCSCVGRSSNCLHAPAHPRATIDQSCCRNYGAPFHTTTSIFSMTRSGSCRQWRWQLSSAHLLTCPTPTPRPLLRTSEGTTSRKPPTSIGTGAMTSRKNGATQIAFRTKGQLGHWAVLGPAAGRACQHRLRRVNEIHALQWASCTLDVVPKPDR